MPEIPRYYSDAAKAQAYVDIMHSMSIYQVWLDDGQFDRVRDAFAEDAVLELSNHTRLEGRDTICGTLGRRREQRMQGIDQSRVFQRHNLTTRLIEVTGPERATGISYFTVTTEIGVDHYGRYFDEFALRDGRWVISYRRIQVDWMHDASRFKVNTGFRAADTR